MKALLKDIKCDVHRHSEIKYHCCSPFILNISIFNQFDWKYQVMIDRQNPSNWLRGLVPVHKARTQDDWNTMACGHMLCQMQKKEYMSGKWGNETSAEMTG